MTLLRQGAFVAALLLFALNSAPEAWGGCRWFLTAPEVARQEQDHLLAAFNPDAPIERVRRLSVGAVYLVTQNGEGYVVRAPGEHADPQYELFLSHVFFHAGLMTPRIRMLTTREGGVVRGKLMEQGIQYVPYTGERWTVAVFHSGLSVGRDHVADARDWSRLDPRLLSDLASHWALRLVMGNPDFHAENWLTDGERVLSVDLAYKNNAFDILGGRFSLDQFCFHPLGADNLKSFTDRSALIRARAFLLPRMSEAMKHFLRGLSPDRLRQYAAESGFSIKTGAIFGILGRRDLVLGYCAAQD